MYKKKRVLVIDGDILAYQIATNNEQPINWGDGLCTLHADENSCIQQLDAVIDDLGSGLSADEYIYQSIVYPNEYIVEGYPANVMPQIFINLDEEELQALVSYLKTIK